MIIIPKISLFFVTLHTHLNKTEYDHKKKKYTLYYVMALACGLVASFFIYSCSADGYYSDEIEKNEVTNTRALSSRMINNGSTLIDSIASSDEFWEFEMSSELLADKFHEYTSTLSEEEYDKLMENLNDDDYVEDFMRKANLENELQQLAKAKENLIQHTGFLRLSADERTQLFILYAESNELTKVKLLKTREEGGSTSSCEEQKQAAYRQAKADYDDAVTNCKKGSVPSGCLTQAAARYDRNKRIADRRYENCIKNKV
ncbi:hypothetical protein NXX89_03350 [Bacteroides thetaiotaomicron]|nr:hypothetical protein [Bacteroides thetaiotaomicron]MCS3210615.1 hypothetical protein [Bacteroides thetaiotaomicron]